MIIQIINNIFISDINTSFESDIYKKYNINIVINCTINHKFINIENIKKVRVPLSFDMDQKDNKLLSLNLDNILNYIKNNVLDNVILITCYDGLRISPLIISLFLLKNIDNIDKGQINDILKSKDKNIYVDYNLNSF